jgi:hypothetical protein
MSVARRLGEFSASDITHHLSSSSWPLDRVAAILKDLEQRGEVEPHGRAFRIAE